MMRRILGRLRPLLNGWDEICTDENARLRTNTIIFTFAISCFFLSMFLLTLITRAYTLTPHTFMLGAISITLFYLQLKTKEYKLGIAIVFGIMAMGMSAYFIYVGTMESLNFLWTFIVPNVAVMVTDIKKSLGYNLIFLAMIALLLRPPLSNLLMAEYSQVFRTVYPIALLFEMLCLYIAEIVRHKTQHRLAETTKKMQSYAYNDPLTGAYNRRALEAHFGDGESSAYGLMFALIDLDLFKDVNDRYGHMVGDRMLCHVVQLIGKNTPPNSTLYRWGGEEFLLVLKTCNEGEGGAILDEICSIIECTPLAEKGMLVPITISIGGICAGPGSTLAECIHQADLCLYEAKTAGRNRVVFVNCA